jgi:CubicO group peptidase (beta-lactamase class C family)
MIAGSVAPMRSLLRSRPFVAVLTGCTVITLAACGGDDAPAATGGSPTETTTDRPADPDDATTTTGPVDGGAVFPDDEWATASPEEVDLDPVALEDLASYLDSTNSNCMAVIKDGYLVDERYWNDTDAETQQEIWSASKSVSATLVGIAQDQGFLDIDQKASDFITEWQGTDSEDITIRNLLSNDSGRYYDFETDYLRMTLAPNRTEFAIALDQQHPIGEHWEYNNSAIQTLEAVLSRSTGQSVNEFAAANLFGPIGSEQHYSTDVSGTEPTFMGVQSSCRDLARFGWLALNEGNWDGEQVVSAEWMREATSPSQDLNPAYGYLWWLNEEGALRPVLGGVDEDLSWPDTPDDAYAALGLGDQIALVLPSQNMVVVREGPYKANDEPVSSVSVNDIGRLATAATTAAN